MDKHFFMWNHHLKTLSTSQLFSTALILLIALNLLILDIHLINNDDRDASPSENQVKNDEGCGTACEEKIEEIVKSYSFSSPSATVQNNSPEKVIIQDVGAQDYFIPLGTGIVSSMEWSNVPGAQAYVNSSAYGTITSVTFEASTAVYNANQDVYVQLYDLTNNHMVWNSTLKASSGINGTLLSATIVLDPGNNLYQVQMKTQIGAPANLTQARIHIQTN